jgi:hypothetical protein
VPACIPVNPTAFEFIATGTQVQKVRALADTLLDLLMR